MTDPRGAIRLRSNVVLDKGPGAHDTYWELVPGEIVSRYQPHRLGVRGAGGRQRQEAGYYVHCSYCGRNAYQIGLEKCEDPRCRFAPSDAEIAQARERHDKALGLIAAERAATARGTEDAEAEPLPPVLDAEAAVARFLAGGNDGVGTSGA